MSDMQKSKVLDKQNLKALGFELAAVTIKYSSLMTTEEGFAISANIVDLIEQTLKYLDGQIERKI